MLLELTQNALQCNTSHAVWHHCSPQHTALKR